MKRKERTSRWGEKDGKRGPDTKTNLPGIKCISSLSFNRFNHCRWIDRSTARMRGYWFDWLIFSMSWRFSSVGKMRYIVEQRSMSFCSMAAASCWSPLRVNWIVSVFFLPLTLIEGPPFVPTLNLTVRARLFQWVSIQLTRRIITFRFEHR